MGATTIVFVHGWGVRSTESYGALAQCLQRAADDARAPDVDIRELWLSQYVSFHDEVRVGDLARAFHAALTRDLGDLLDTKRRFVCVTHSTGGPIVRTWLHQQLREHPSAVLPISHLIMLAPPTYGSALAQLGKTNLARLKAWFAGVEPGVGVLDWLELGSPESLDLARCWLRDVPSVITDGKTFPFVLQGMSIDRALYDHLAPYTGEEGSDGVARVAGANPNTRWLSLAQEAVSPAPQSPHGALAPLLHTTAHEAVDGLAMCLVPGRSHSGSTMGIMGAVIDDGGADPVVDAIVSCLGVQTRAEYDQLAGDFELESERVQAAHQLERLDAGERFERTIIHDVTTMLIVRVNDDHGYPVNDFDLKLTAGQDSSPDRLPPGFLIDRQRNERAPNTVTLYLNYTRLTGAEAIFNHEQPLRAALRPAPGIGLSITPFPLNGFVRYLPAALPASTAHMHSLISPNQTTVIDITLRRIVGSGTYRLTRNLEPDDFTDARPGAPLA